MAVSVDLNCDMGEGYGMDELIFPFISSVNIACGYHAGDEPTIRQSIALALQHKVAVGAHPAYPDREGFGRKEMHFSSAEVYRMVTEQVMLIRTIAGEMGAVLHHVKPHGALYNSAAKNTELAKAIAQAVHDIDSGLWLYGLSGSQSGAAAFEAGIPFQHEVFADRTYAEDATLTPRSSLDALITDEEKALAQVLQMINKGTVQTQSGKTIAIKADTICIHGDGNQAAAFAKKIYQTLTENRVRIKAAT
jgi:UPF0271 protein